MAGVNMAEVQEGIITAVTSKLGDSTDAEAQFFSTSQAFKKSKITGKQFVSYSVETLGADTASVVMPQMILLLAKYPERQESLREAITEAGLDPHARAEHAKQEAAKKLQREAGEAAQAVAAKQKADAAAVTAAAAEKRQAADAAAAETRQAADAAADQQKAAQIAENKRQDEEAKAERAAAKEKKRQNKAAQAAANAAAASAPPPPQLSQQPVSQPARAEPSGEVTLGMKSLVPLIQKVQEALGTVKQLNLAQMVDLPQIVVIGSQSAGKSSVLESIVGHEFLPRGSGVVTRRPLVLHLYTSEETYGEFSHKSGERFSDFGAIKKEIEAETARVAGSNYGISPHPIALKVYSPDVLNLTLVDTPGVTKVPVGDQPKNIETEIRNMIIQFIERPTCLILALTAANTDLANSDALKLAREVDPEGHRTIGVLTKLDLMDAGTHAGAILNNRVVVLKHGYVGIMNRSQKDIDSNKTIKQHLADEEAFCDAHTVYANMTNVGCRVLSRRLNSILVSHIAAALPELRVRVGASLKKVSTELQQMGFQELDSDTDNAGAGLLLTLLTDYANQVRCSVEGSTRPLNSKMMVGGARISFILDEILVPEMASLDALSGLTDEDIRTAMRNTKGAKTWLFIPEDSFELLAKRQVSQLEGPAVRCVEMVLAELQTLCGECEMKDIRKFSNLPIEVMNVVNEMVHDFAEGTTKLVQNLIAVEKTHINLQHPDFVDVVQSLSDNQSNGQSTVSEEEQALKQREEQSKQQGFVSNFFGGQGALNKEKAAMAARHMKMSSTLTVTETGDMSVREQRGLEMIHHMLNRYFAIVRRKICDQISKAIMAKMVNRLKDELSKTLVSKLYRNHDVLQLLKETEEVRCRRRQLCGMKDALESCLNILDEAHSMGARITM